MKYHLKCSAREERARARENGGPARKTLRREAVFVVVKTRRLPILPLTPQKGLTGSASWGRTPQERGGSFKAGCEVGWRGTPTQKKTILIL